MSASPENTAIADELEAIAVNVAPFAVQRQVLRLAARLRGEELELTHNERSEAAHGVAAAAAAAAAAVEAEEVAKAAAEAAENAPS